MQAISASLWRHPMGVSGHAMLLALVRDLTAMRSTILAPKLCFQILCMILPICPVVVSVVMINTHHTAACCALLT